MTGKLTKYGKRFLEEFTALIASSVILQGTTTLSIALGNSSTLQIRLNNDQAVAGLQFVLKSSSDVVIDSFRKAGRTIGGNWIVASNRVNDSTIIAVIVSSDISYLSAGEGVLAELSFTKDAQNPCVGRIVLTNVIVANPEAQKITVTVNDLTLPSNRSLLVKTQSDFTLGQNFPNPFNLSTRISYQLKKSAVVRLSVYDLTGKEIGRLVAEYQVEGVFSVTWQSREQRGFQLSSGTYFARLQIGENVLTRKMTLVK